MYFLRVGGPCRVDVTKCKVAGDVTQGVRVVAVVRMTDLLLTMEVR